MQNIKEAFRNLSLQSRLFSEWNIKETYGNLSVYSKLFQRKIVHVEHYRNHWHVLVFQMKILHVEHYRNHWHPVFVIQTFSEEKFTCRALQKPLTFCLGILYFYQGNIFFRKHRFIKHVNQYNFMERGKDFTLHVNSKVAISCL